MNTGSGRDYGKLGVQLNLKTKQISSPKQTNKQDYEKNPS